MAEDKGKIRIGEELLKDGFVQLPVALVKWGRVPPGAKLAYAMLLWYGWRNGEYPGHEQMAYDLGVTERSIKNYMSQLQKAGLVDVERPGLGKTNSYYLPPLGERIFPSRGKEHSQQRGKSLPPTSLEFVNTLKTKTKEASFSSELTPADKTVLMATIISEFAPNDSMQAIQTYIARFPVALITRAAEITRANSHVTNPIAYLYGVIQRLQEQETTQPAAHQHVEVAPELTEAEYTAALESLDRVKMQLTVTRQAESKE